MTDARIEQRIDALMAKMTLEEKVGQIIQADISTITPADLAKYPLGSVLAGGNSGPDRDDHASATAWVTMTTEFYQAAAAPRNGRPGIPLLFGIDAVHGHNNIPGATLFPHNIGLGAMRDADLIRSIGQVTAAEVTATGVNWTFAPTVAVARDPRWGRTYESWSEDPALVAAYAPAMVQGLQGGLEHGRIMEKGRTVATVKHFLADGGTERGHDQADARISETELINIHAAGYPPSIQAGALTVMASFSSWNGVKMHGNKELLTDILKQRLGFEGFVIGDWNGHGSVPGCSDKSCAAAINAGLDMFMAPNSWKELYDNTLIQVRDGTIPAGRLDDAVRRVLRVKFLAGLFEPTAVPAPELIGNTAHRAVAREAVRKSLVLLKNEKGLLPLKANARVLVAGDGADNPPKQSGGWTITWQGADTKPSDFPGFTSIFAGLQSALKAGGGTAILSPDGHYDQRPDIAVVVFGEDPYAEFQGDLDNLEYQSGDKRDLALLKKLKADGIPVVSVFLSGRPLWVNPELNASDAFVAAWLPGSEGDGLADVLIRAADGRIRYDFTGRLPFSWPRTALVDTRRGAAGDTGPLFAVGYGLTYAAPSSVAVLLEQSGLPEAEGNRIAYFRSGRVIAPWSVQLIDAAGDVCAAGFRQNSPTGTVELRAVDVSTQEDGRSVTWNGKGLGVLMLHGRAADLTSQSAKGWALNLRYRLDQAATAPVTLTMACSAKCQGDVTITTLLRQAPIGQPSRLQVPLHCFAAAGADLTQIDTPFRLSTTGILGLTFTELTLEPADQTAKCPS